MKILSTTLLFFLLSLYSFAQVNLVRNPSFEEFIGDSCQHQGAGGQNYYDNLNYWNKQIAWTIPERRWWCPDGVGVGTSDWDCNGGHTGAHYGFGTDGEYITQELINPMIAGLRYYVEYWVKGGTVGYDGGIRLQTERPKQCGGANISDRNTPPQFPIATGGDISNWYRMAYYYTADENYSWIVLGCFRNCNESHSFDDITIMEIGIGICPDVHYIQNTHFENIGKIIYNSQDLTIAGSNVASTLAQGPVVVGSTAIVEFRSEQQVILENGFSTEPGAYFEARIAPCDVNTNCFPIKPVNAGQDVTVCGTTAQLGAAPEDNTTYSWTANPTSAIAHLSSTTVANPVFSPIAGVPGGGKITYTVTATNECGESVTDNVTVLYEPAPNNSPTVNVSNVVYSDMIEFDVTFSNHTEQLFIEVTTSSGTPVANYTYHLGQDFSCCSYHWKIPVALSPCNDYTVKVYTKNMCSNVLSSPVILNWIRNRNVSFTYVSNVITNNSPNWCFGFTGAVQYELFITSAGGAPVYNGSGSITPPQACIWSGQCNQQCLSSTVKDGTYYYVLTIKGCDGKSVTQTGFIMVMINKRSEASVDENDTTAAVADNAIFGIEAFPNPSSGIVNLQINGLQNSLSKNKVQVYNSLGSVVYTTESNNRQLEIDLSNQAQGIYNIKVETEYGIKTTKIIYTK